MGRRTDRFPGYAVRDLGGDRDSNRLALARRDADLVQGVHLQCACREQHFSVSLDPLGECISVGLSEGA